MAVTVGRRVLPPLACAALLATTWWAAPAAGQAPDSSTHRPWYVTASAWGRWGALAGAVGFSAVAIVRNRDANTVFRGLTAYCVNAAGACALGETGRYVDASAETLYQETLRLDRQARLWMIAGQASLAAAGIMFLIDLVSGDDEPNNIPFAPFGVIAQPGRLGLRYRF